MLPEMTPAVARALQSAQIYAAAETQTHLTPLHVLRALLEEEEGRAVELALRAGLDWNAFQASRLSALSAEPGDAAALLPLHDLTRAALNQARKLARDLSGETTVTSEVLLFALLREIEETRTYLAAFGFQFAQLEQALLAQQAPPLQLEEPLELTDVTETVDTARILDACANRAREGLRVVEDYCRFVLEDASLSGQLKQLRHDLAVALSQLKPEVLLQARDTPGDVGTSLSTEREHDRRSLLDVARANWKRLQEALRSLEEFGKLHSGELSRALEQLRYRSYTLEQAILLGASIRQRLADVRLYVLLSSSGCTGSLESTIAQAAEGGVQMIQLREKELSDRELLERARQARLWTRRAGIHFIVNDRPDLARLVEADGVHLGQDDMPVREARRILGPDALIGVSTHTIEQVRQAVLDGASYLGVGPTFPSKTKEFPIFAGLDFVRQACAETTLPVFAIGGIDANNLGDVLDAGARRVAVSHAIAQAQDPRAMARQFRLTLEQAASPSLPRSVP